MRLMSVPLAMILMAVVRVSAAAAPAAPAASASAPAPSGQAPAAARGNANARTGTFAANHNPALPTLFLIGDSTVKNGRDTGGDGLWGWGRPIAAYFDLTKINVDNQALGGTSSHSYQTANWPGVLALVKKGDFVMMQFGHNDNGGASLRGIGEDTQPGRGGAGEPTHSYGWYMRKYVTDTKAKGATPIICSLIPRNDWTDGKIRRSPDDSFPTWARQVAEQEKIGFIDLNKLSSDRLDKLGQEASALLYPKEHTHTGWKGAVLNAECVIEGIKKMPDSELNKYLNAEPKPVKPASDPTNG